MVDLKWDNHISTQTIFSHEILSRILIGINFERVFPEFMNQSFYEELIRSVSFYGSNWFGNEIFKLLSLKS